MECVFHVNNIGSMQEQNISLCFVVMTSYICCYFFTQTKEIELCIAAELSFAFSGSNPEHLEFFGDFDLHLPARLLFVEGLHVPSIRKTSSNTIYVCLYACN